MSRHLVWLVYIFRLEVERKVKFQKLGKMCERVDIRILIALRLRNEAGTGTAKVWGSGEGSADVRLCGRPVEVANVEVGKVTCWADNRSSGSPSHVEENGGGAGFFLWHPSNPCVVLDLYACVLARVWRSFVRKSLPFDKRPFRGVP